MRFTRSFGEPTYKTNIILRIVYRRLFRFEQNTHDKNVCPHDRKRQRLMARVLLILHE